MPALDRITAQTIWPLNFLLRQTLTQAASIRCCDALLHGNLCIHISDCSSLMLFGDHLCSLASVIACDGQYTLVSRSFHRGEIPTLYIQRGIASILCCCRTPSQNLVPLSDQLPVICLKPSARLSACRPGRRLHHAFIVIFPPSFPVSSAQPPDIIHRPARACLFFIMFAS